MTALDLVKCLKQIKLQKFDPSQELINALNISNNIDCLLRAQLILRYQQEPLSADILVSSQP